MHADAAGVPVIVGECADAPLLGAAIVAAAASGVHPTIDAAAERMVRVARRVEPNAAAAAQVRDAVFIRPSPRSGYFRVAPRRRTGARRCFHLAFTARR